VRSESRASLAGIALALRALTRLLGRTVQASEIVFAQGEKPRLAPPAALDARAAAGAPLRRERAARCAEEDTAVDFSISHAGPWVACAALAHGRVGLDLEMGTGQRIAEWVVLEAALKASGEGVRALREVESLQVRDGRLSRRGGVWHVRSLEGFEGASACVVSSLEIRAVENHSLVLAELFDT
jgi:hypothetical protein